MVVIGMSGAGKSTAARRLAAMLNVRDACASGLAWIELRTARAVNDWLRTLEGMQAEWTQVPRA